QIAIGDLSDQVFYARISMQANGSTTEVDARPSDAIALAVRVGCRILVDETVMDSAGVAIEDEDDAEALSAGSLSDDESTSEPEHSDAAPAASDEQLSVFRDFINSLDLDDFGKRQSN